MKNLFFFASFSFFLQGCYQQEGLKKEKTLFMSNSRVESYIRNLFKKELIEKVNLYRNIIKELKPQLKALQRQDPENETYQIDLEEFDQRETNLDLVAAEMQKINQNILNGESELIHEMEKFLSIIGSLKNIEALQFDQKQACIEAVNRENERKAELRNKELTEEEKEKLIACTALIEELKLQLEVLQRQDPENKTYQKDLDRLNELKGNFDPTKKMPSQIRDGIYDFNTSIGRLKKIEKLVFDQKQTCIEAVKKVNERKAELKNKELTKEEKGKINSCIALIEKLKLQLEALQRQNPENKSYQIDLEKLTKLKESFDSPQKTSSQIRNAIQDFPRNIGFLKNKETLQFNQQQVCIEAVSRAKESQAKSINKELTQEEKEKLIACTALIEELKLQLEALQRQDLENKTYQIDLEKLTKLKESFDSTQKTPSQIRNAIQDFNKTLGRLKKTEKLIFDQQQACIEAAKKANENQAKSRSKELTQEEKEKLNASKALIENLKKQLEDLQIQDPENKTYQKDLEKLTKLKESFNSTQKTPSQIRNAIQNFNKTLGRLKKIEKLAFDQKQACIEVAKKANENQAKSRNKELTEEEKGKINACTALIEELKLQLEALQTQDSENKIYQKDLEKLTKLKESFNSSQKTPSQIRNAIQDFPRNIGCLKNLKALQFDQQQACIEAANREKESQAKSRKRKRDPVDSDNE